MKLFTVTRVVIVGVILAAIICLLPTFFDCWPHKKINLGLDLQGGMHLMLQVQSQKAIESEVNRIIKGIKEELRAKKVRYRGVSRTTSNSILVKLQSEADKKTLDTILSESFSALVSSSPKTENDLILVTLSLSDKETAYIKKLATEQALETIRNRIDEFGVLEPDIRIQGGDRILLQLPGIKDPDRAKKLLEKTAHLTFQLVNDEANVGAALSGNVPVGSEILYEVRVSDSGQKREVPYLVYKEVLLDGSNLINARVEFDNFQRPRVGIEFNRTGARDFEQVTGKYTHKRLAIILDKKVYSAPTIQGRIAGGKASITGTFSFDEASDLAIALRAGSLPAPVTIMEERTVGPTLGADSIRMGLTSMVVGGLLVILFMVIYYRGAGLIADLALMVNILLIGGGLAAFGATLTLPGIAGIILTIGMAVDANVIIFERIREELRSGKTVLASVHAGFDRATLTILDANVTTLIAGVVLLQFGTGPIKGFAVTLILGILASLFTALILSKSIFDLVLKIKKSNTLSI